MSEARIPKLYEVPADTTAATCTGPNCRKPIYFITTPKGKQMPIDCHAGEGCTPPTAERPGSGVPHFGTCVDVKRFDRPKA